nr:MAG TPA: hypothetical protein [Caudoviricetes sp.]
MHSKNKSPYLQCQIIYYTIIFEYGISAQYEIGLFLCP